MIGKRMRIQRNCKGFSEYSCWESFFIFWNHHIKKRRQTLFSTSIVNWEQRSNLLTIKIKLKGSVLEDTRAKVSCSGMWVFFRRMWLYFRRYIHWRIFLQNSAHKCHKAEKKVNYSYPGPQFGNLEFLQLQLQNNKTCVTFFLNNPIPLEWECQ